MSLGEAFAYRGMKGMSAQGPMARVRTAPVFVRTEYLHQTSLLPADPEQCFPPGDYPRSLDIYVWLAYRCHQLQNPTAISWPSLYAQFGAGFKAPKHFKPSFIEALGAAVAAYPEARADVEETGVTLHPARPPIAHIPQ